MTRFRFLGPAVPGVPVVPTSAFQVPSYQRLVFDEQHDPRPPPTRIVISRSSTQASRFRSGPRRHDHDSRPERRAREHPVARAALRPAGVRVSRARGGRMAPGIPTAFWRSVTGTSPDSRRRWRCIERIVNDTVVARGVPKERIVLLGFSQGACLAAEFAASHADRYGGVIVFTRRADRAAGHDLAVHGHLQRHACLSGMQ